MKAKNVLSINSIMSEAYKLQTKFRVVLNINNETGKIYKVLNVNHD